MNTEKLTPQELCLYFGQEVQVHDNYDVCIVGKLVAVTDKRVEVSEDTVYGLSEWPIENCKLRHRSLSDITEEEFGQYLSLGFDSLLGGQFKAYTISQTVYLLSKGFDLFNWIEQGKALDKTKEVHEQK